MSISNKLLNINTIEPSSTNVRNSLNINQTKNIKYTNSILPDKYNITKFLGKGLYGNIYLARNNNSITSDKHPELICKLISLPKNNNKEIKKQILLEITILKHIASDRNSKYIVPSIDYGFTETHIYILFPKFTGYKLKNIYSKLKQLSQSSYNIIVPYIIKQILMGLSIIHKKQIAHQNINDSSIIIDIDIAKNIDLNDNKIIVKFIDFGMACGLYLDDNASIKLQSKKAKTHDKNKYYVKKCLELSDYFIASGKDTDKTKSNVELNIKKLLKNLKTDDNLQLARLYDIWCCGLVIYNLIYCRNENSNIPPTELDGIQHNLAWHKTFKINYTRNTELKRYETLLQKYMLVPISKRKNAKYCLDEIILNEKYNN